MLSLFPANDYALIAVILGMPLLGAFVIIRLGFLSGPANAGTSIPGYFASFSFTTVPWTRLVFGAWSGAPGPRWREV